MKLVAHGEHVRAQRLGAAALRDHLGRALRHRVERRRERARREQRDLRMARGGEGRGERVRRQAGTRDARRAGRASLFSDDASLRTSAGTYGSMRVPCNNDSLISRRESSSRSILRRCERERAERGRVDEGRGTRPGEGVVFRHF